MGLVAQLSFLLFFSLFIQASASAYPAHQKGYIQNVKAEKEIQFYEVFLFAEPAVKEKPLSEVIFNTELSKEFRNRYREKFGTLDTDSIAYQRDDYSRLDLFRANPQAEDKNSERHRFADYMVKRLVEWHLDHYIRSEPNLAPVYELKEKLKKVEVKVDKETKVEARYSFAENILDIIVDNKYFDETKISLDLDRHVNSLLIGKSINSRNRIENLTWEGDGRSQLQWIKNLTNNLSTTYAISAAYKEGSSPRDTRIASGFGYRF